MDARNLPELLKTRSGESIVSPGQWEAHAECLRGLFEREEYGILPDAPVACTYQEIFSNMNNFHSGRSTVQTIRVTCSRGQEEYSWPFHMALPKSNSPVPVILHIHFGTTYPVDTVPVEEICRRGFGYVMVKYGEITSDDGDFTNGIARLFYPDGERKEHDAGKIALWAWAMQRILDYLQTDPRVNADRVVTAGHSRLGKTALWAAAGDRRFFGVVSNASGCSGASLSRGNTGEQTWQIVERFPYWFAPAYAKYNHRAETLPFDQHQLLALIAPRKLYVMSGAEDSWADPASEYAAATAASPVWELFGEKGVRVLDEEEIGEDIELNEGTVGYQRNPGTHFFGMTAWTRLMNFLEKHPD